MKKHKLNVLHLGSPSGLYGAERWILALVAYLDPELVESTVGVINDQEYLQIPLCKAAEARGIRTVTFDGFGKVNLAVLKRLREYIIEEQIDIVHTHFYKTDLLGLMAARGTDCRVISTPHGFASRPSRRLWLYENVGKLVFPFMDVVVPLSNALFEALTKIPGMRRNMKLIENGVDVREASAERPIADELGVLKNQGKFVIGYIGRLEAGKDLETLLRAMAEDDHPDWHAALVGEGAHRVQLEKLAKQLGLVDKVSFFGFREDRLAFLAGFDIFVLPSRSEGIPRCLMEAMASRVPVIASDIPGCRNLVDGSTTGLLFKVGNEHELEQRITGLQQSNALRKSLADEARRFVERKYSCERMAREYEDLYKQLVPLRSAS